MSLFLPGQALWGGKSLTPNCQSRHGFKIEIMGRKSSKNLLKYLKDIIIQVSIDKSLKLETEHFLHQEFLHKN